jgi:hypothetical protein
MDVFSTEQGIQLSFVKTLEFEPPPHGTPLPVDKVYAELVC